jgi:hypothetical protein
MREMMVKDDDGTANSASMSSWKGCYDLRKAP